MGVMREAMEIIEEGRRQFLWTTPLGLIPLP